MNSPAQNAFEVVKPYVEKAVEEGLPIVESAAKEGAVLATPLLQKAADQAIALAKDSGVDVVGVSKDVSAFSSKAFDTAAPVAKEAVSAAESLAAQDPNTLLTAGGIVAAALLLSPVLGPLLLDFLRGYSGDLAPTAVLTVLSSRDGTLVDLRSATQIEAKGVPGLPKGSSGRLVKVEFDTVTDRALRGSLRDPLALEAESTALIISSLKRVQKGRPVILIDGGDASARLVAKALTSQGFRSVYTVQGGFDGWVRSGLAVAGSSESSGRLMLPM